MAKAGKYGSKFLIDFNHYSRISKELFSDCLNDAHHLLSDRIEDDEKEKYSLSDEIEVAKTLFEFSAKLALKNAEYSGKCEQIELAQKELKEFSE